MAKPGVDFILEQCQLQLERQLRDIDALDNKAIGIASAASVLLAVVPATHFAAHDGTAALSTTAVVLVLIAGVSYLGVLAATGWCFMVRRFNVPPNPLVLYEAYLEIDPALTKEQIAGDIAWAYTYNRRRLGRKQLGIVCGLAALVVETLVLFAGLVFG